MLLQKKGWAGGEARAIHMSWRRQWRCYHKYSMGLSLLTLSRGASLGSLSHMYSMRMATVGMLQGNHCPKKVTTQQIICGPLPFVASPQGIRFVCFAQ
jgi:hypothetical protein